MEKNKEKRPLILISNDDGFSFNGIKALIKVARKYGDVVAVAPTTQQSGKGCSVTFFTPLRLHKVKADEGFSEYQVQGTPTDCVKLAFDQLLTSDRQPDLVLSGINHGYNLGSNVLYSGTLGAVFEAAVHRVPAVAFSAEPFAPDTDFTPYEPWIERVLTAVLRDGLPEGTFLNVNMPANAKGIKVAHTGMGRWVNEYEHRVDPHGFDYYWAAGDYQLDHPDDADTDVALVRSGWVAVVPCRADPTEHSLMGKIATLLS